jgi:hypothetical protein
MQFIHAGHQHLNYVRSLGDDGSAENSTEGNDDDEQQREFGQRPFGKIDDLDGNPLPPSSLRHFYSKERISIPGGHGMFLPFIPFTREFYPYSLRRL